MANNRNIVQLCVHENEELVRSEKCYLEKWRTSLALKNRWPKLEEHRKTNQDHQYSERGLPYSAMAFMARSSSCLFSHLISACFTSKPLKIPSPTVTESRLQGGGDRDVWLTEVLLSSLVVGIGSGGNWGQGTTHCPHQRTNTWARNLTRLFLPQSTKLQQTVICLLVYSFIFSLPFVVLFPQDKMLSLGEVVALPQAHCQLLNKKGPIWAVSSWALPHASLVCVKS